MGRSAVLEHMKPLVDALRVLVTPGLYAAALEESPLIDLPVVIARAGPGAPVSTRAQVFIQVLEEAVDSQLRNKDRLAAKILFALGGQSGRPVKERHHEVAKLRDRNWTWERNYRKEPLSRDLLMVALALQRLGGETGRTGLVQFGSGEGVAAKSTAPDPSGTVAETSRRLLQRLGRRRTAYPLDMSLAELHDNGLFVETRLVKYHGRGARGISHSIDDLVGALSQGRSVLLLGEPGSGKSLVLYETALRCAAAGILPIAVRARDHAESPAGVGLRDLRTASGTALLVDGLDEAAEPVAGGPDVVAALSDLVNTRPILVTSRRREYEDEISARLQDVDFDEVYVLRPWTVEEEFRDYLRRLTGAGLVEDPSLYASVVTSEHLSDLVARPLYARMLTFVGQQSVRSVAEPDALYGEYLAKLARTTDASIPTTDGALTIWKSAAWHVYVSGLQSGDTISMPELRGLPVRGPDDGSARRVLDQIIDTRSVQGRELGEFLHYSFYEYLVARQVCDVLLQRPGADSLVEMLRHDLTREIRHHLVGQLRLAPFPYLREVLLEAYRSARAMPGIKGPERLIACNLLIYLLSRMLTDSEGPLMRLLAEEEDSFLRCAILWALCHRGSERALGEFFDRLEVDARWRSECRGYVLYYYGDLRKEDGPPYYDEPPYSPCANTYRRIVAMFERSRPGSVRPERGCIDLYTFLDVLLIRSVPVPPSHLGVLESFAGLLHAEGLPATVMARLEEMIDVLTRAT